MASSSCLLAPEMWVIEPTWMPASWALRAPRMAFWKHPG